MKKDWKNRKINWKLVNAAFWIEVMLAYILPFRTVDELKYMAGFPLPFLAMYDHAPADSLLNSMHFNPLAFVINGILLYEILDAGVKIYHKIKK